MTQGVNESLIHSPIATQAKYAYRSKAGIIPSAEYSVYFNDFYEAASSNAIPGTTAVIDTGATLTNDGTICYTGALDITSDGTSEGVALYWPAAIQLGQGKKFFMEVRCYTEDADDTDVQFGLTDLTATTNPEDLYTTASADLIAVGVLDGDATLGLLTDKNNGGDTVQLASGTTYDLADATWTTLAFEVTGTASAGTMSVKVYKDGALAITSDTETTIPDDLALAPFIAGRTGGDAAHNVYFDYIRWSLER